jgi:lipopolysaccharide exporter
MEREVEQQVAQDGYHQVGRGIRWSSLSALVLRISTFLVGVVAARLIAPREFGVFAVALTVYGIVLTLSDLGVTQAIIREVDNTREIGPSVMTLNLLATVFLAGTMALLAEPITGLLGAVEAAPAIRVLALTMVVGCLGSVPAAILARDYRQRERFLSDASNALVSAVVLIALALLGFGVMALAWSRLAGQAASAVALNVQVKERYPFGLTGPVATRLLRFSLPLAGAFALTVAIQNVDTITISTLEGTEELGYYNLAFTVASWPVGILTGILMNTTMTTFARSRGNREELRAHVEAATTTLLAASLPVGGLLAVLALPLVQDIYGTRWSPAAAPLVALGAFVSARIVQFVLSDILVAEGMTGQLLALQALWLVFLIPAMFVGVRLGGITGAAVAHLVVGLFVVIPAYLLTIHRRVHLGLSWLTPGLSWPLLGTLAASGAAWLVSERTASPWAGLLLGGLAGGAVYLAICWRWIRRHVARIRATYFAAAPELGA